MILLLLKYRADTSSSESLCLFGASAQYTFKKSNKTNYYAKCIPKKLLIHEATDESLQLLAVNNLMHKTIWIFLFR